ncbi:MAG TPA: HEAT repeat domain-containing protein [Nitrospirota bacterium]
MSDTLGELLDKLKNGDAPARYLAANKIGKLGDKSAVDHLLTALRDQDMMVADNIIFALGELGDQKAVHALVRLLRVGSHEKLRKSAAKALGMLGSKDAVDPLIAALSDPDYKVRKSAARSLGKIGDPRAIPALGKAAEDSDYNVSKHAKEALDKLQAIHI